MLGSKQCFVCFEPGKETFISVLVDLSPKCKMLCRCRSNLKTCVCKRAIDLSMHFGFDIIADPNKVANLSKRRERPKKAKPALSR